jgi:hypothetical protein
MQTITPTPVFMQAVRQTLHLDDLIPGPDVVIPALRDPVIGLRIEAAHHAILASYACRTADEAAHEARENLETLTPEDLGYAGLTAEEVIASEWRCWFEGAWNLEHADDEENDK